MTKRQKKIERILLCVILVISLIMLIWHGNVWVTSVGAGIFGSVAALMIANNKEEI